MAKVQQPQVDSARVDVLEVLKDLSHGDVAFEASQKLGDIAKRVLETGKSGELVIKIKLTPQPKMGGSATLFEADVEARMPKPDRKTDVRFLTEDGQIKMDDPRQMRFGFDRATSE